MCSYYGFEQQNKKKRKEKGNCPEWDDKGVSVKDRVFKTFVIQRCATNRPTFNKLWVKIIGKIPEKISPQLFYNRNLCHLKRICINFP